METQRAKLLPPAVAPTVLARPALERKLDEAFGARLTTVVAGSGFGKSTAVAAWATDVRCVWYTLAPGDAPLGSLVRGLVDVVEAGTGSTIPGPRLVEGEAGDLDRPELLAAYLARELDRRLEHDLVIVLDDVHELGRTGPSTQLIDAFCRQLPPTAHLVLVSRFEPPFPTGRLRGRGELVEIDAATLAFGPDEVLALASQMLGDEAASLSETISEQTGGWPVAVRLVLESLRAAPPEERLRTLSLVPEELFAYLAEEVIEREPRATRELIRILAPFERVSAQLAEELGVSDAARRLESLVRRGLFVVRHGGGGGWFSLHALVRDLAAQRLGLDNAARAALQSRAARWYEARGALDAALQAYVLATDRHEVARLLAEHGPDLLAAGDPSRVIQAAELVSEDVREPRVEQAIGDAHALRGEWGQALASYERAAGDDDELSAALAWRMGRIHFDQGRLDDALEVYSRGREDRDTPGDQALLLAWTASCCWSRGDRTESLSLAEEALSAATAAGEPRALAVAHNVLMLVALGGDPAGGAAHFHAGLAAAEQAGDTQLVVRLRANRATQLGAEGAYDEALAVIAPAIEAAELAGGGLQVAFPLMKRGESYLYLGRLEDAVADFKSAFAVYERFGSLRRFGALVNLGDAYAIRGDVTLARAALEEAVRAGQESNDAQLVLFGSVSLARALAFDEPGRAAQLARRAAATGRRLGFGLELALLSSGWVALAAARRTDAARFAARAAAEAEKRNSRPALAESLVLRALAAPEPAAHLALLEEAASIWREAGDELSEAVTELLRARLSSTVDSRGSALAAERTLRMAGVRIASAARVAGPLAFLPVETPPEVEVRTLGAFAVLRDGRPIPTSSWKSRQARELLKVLVARRCRAVPRDQLMSVLWPDEEPGKLSGRFSFVLSTLRSVLDPEHSKGASSFLDTDGDAVRLRGDLVAVDVETFLRDAERGLAGLGVTEESVAQLEHTEAAYGGDFLEEDAYADWAVPLREQARAAYIAVARALAEHRIAAGDHAGAVRYLLRILERDGYDEHAHLQLVAALEASGAHGEGRRAYRRYVAAMAELDVEPAPYPGRV